MITISKNYSFDSAHMLWDENLTEDENWNRFGKCSRLHGHTYYLDVTVSGDIDPDTGMILNYHDLDKIMKPLVDRIDHYYLNEIFPHLTTAELMVDSIAKWILDDLDAVGWNWVTLDSVMLQETAKTSAVWSRE